MFRIMVFRRQSDLSNGLFALKQLYLSREAMMKTLAPLILVFRCSQRPGVYPGNRAGRGRPRPGAERERERGHRPRTLLRGCRVSTI